MFVLWLLAGILLMGVVVFILIVLGDRGWFMKNMKVYGIRYAN